MLCGALLLAVLLTAARVPWTVWGPMLAAAAVLCFDVMLCFTVSLLFLPMLTYPYECWRYRKAANDWEARYSDRAWYTHMDHALREDDWEPRWTPEHWQTWYEHMDVVAAVNAGAAPASVLPSPPTPVPEYDEYCDQFWGFMPAASSPAVRVGVPRSQRR